MKNEDGIVLIEGLEEYYEQFCGIFSSSSDKDLGIELLESIGVPDNRVFFLTLFFTHNNTVQKVKDTISKIRNIKSKLSAL